MSKTEAFVGYILNGGPVPHELRPKGGRFVAGGDGCIVPRSIVAQMFSKSCAYTGSPFTSQHSDMTAIVGRDNFGQTMDVDWRGSGLVGRCTIVPAKSGVAHIIVEDNSDAAEHAGAAVQWLECEGDEKDETQYKMIGKEITCHELQAYTEITDRAIKRARNDLPGMLAQAFRAAIIEELERAIIQGSGTGELTGIVNTTGVLTRARDCAGAVRLNDIIGLKYAIAPRYRDDAQYMFEDDAAQLVEAATIMIDSGGPLFTSTHALGIPWKATTQSPKLGSDGDAIIGDWSKYVLAMGQDIVVKRGQNNDSFKRNVTPISVYMIVGGEAVVPRAFAYLTAVGQGAVIDLCVSPPKSVTLDEPVEVTLDEPIAVTLDEPITITVATDDTVIGPTNANAADAGAEGSVNAKLRRLTNDIDSIDTRIGPTTSNIVDAGAEGSVNGKLRRLTNDLDSIDVRIGPTTSPVVDAGAEGSVNSKLRRVTTDIDSIDSNIGPTNAAIVNAGDEGSVNAKLRRVTADIAAIKNALLVDDMTGAQATIDYAHHEIHEGDSFLCDVLTTNTTSLCFKVPAGTKRVHLNFSWGAESKATLEIWEGRTWTQGTEVATQPIFNRDRNSGTASIVQDDSTGAFAANNKMLVTPTLVANGTEIHHEQTWSDKKETFTARAISEFILKNGETYVVLLVSNDGIKGTQIILDWYEHTDSA